MQPVASLCAVVFHLFCPKYWFKTILKMHNFFLELDHEVQRFEQSGVELVRPGVLSAARRRPFCMTWEPKKRKFQNFRF